MKKLFTLFVFLHCLAITNAQETPFHYFNAVGKFNEPINEIAQDKEGRLLLATQTGLISYNGYTTRKFSIQGATSKEITNLFLTEKGVFVLNNHGQLFELKKDTLKLLAIAGLNAEIKDIAFEGAYFIVHTAKEKVVTNFASKKIISREPYLYAEDEKTTIQLFGLKYAEPFHVTSNNELIFPKEGEARDIPFLSSKIKFGCEIDGSVILTGDRATKGNVIAYAHGQFKKLNLPTDEKNAHINDIRIIHEALMILTDKGCYYFNHGIQKEPSHWFSGIACTDAFADDLGNTWISTKSNGLILIPKGKHKKITSESSASIQMWNGELIVGNNSAGILRLQQNGNVLERLNNENLVDNISKVDYDPYLKGYFVQNGLIAGKTFVSFNKRIHSAKRDGLNALLLSTNKGLYRYPAAPLKTFLIKSKKDTYGALLLEGNCFILEKNPLANQFLAANEEGIFLVDGAEVKEVRKSNKSIQIISATWFKNAWYVITTGNALYKIVNGKVTNVRYLNEMGVINVMKLQASGNNLYLLTEAGLYRTSEIHAPFEALKDVIGFDGIFIRDFCAKNDEVFLATQRGVFSYLWKDVKPSLAKFVVDDPQNNDKEETQNRKFYSGNVDLPVECIDLTGTRGFRLQYRIVSNGEKGSWVEVVPETRKISLSSLSSGNYDLELRMIDPISGLTTEIQHKSFEVPYRWYQSKLLWIAVGAILVLAVQFLVKRLKRIEKS